MALAILFPVLSIYKIVGTYSWPVHTNSSKDITIPNGSAIITAPFVAQKLEGIGEKVKGLRAGESVMIKDVTFYAQYCKHPANQPLSFIIKTKENYFEKRDFSNYYRTQWY